MHLSKQPKRHIHGIALAFGMLHANQLLLPATLQLVIRPP